MDSSETRHSKRPATKLGLFTLSFFEWTHLVVQTLKKSHHQAPVFLLCLFLLPFFLLSLYFWSLLFMLRNGILFFIKTKPVAIKQAFQDCLFFKIKSHHFTLNFPNLSSLVSHLSYMEYKIFGCKTNKYFTDRWAESSLLAGKEGVFISSCVVTDKAKSKWVRFAKQKLATLKE